MKGSSALLEKLPTSLFNSIYDSRPSTNATNTFSSLDYMFLQVRDPIVSNLKSPTLSLAHSIDSKKNITECQALQTYGPYSLGTIKYLIND